MGKPVIEVRSLTFLHLGGPKPSSKRQDRGLEMGCDLAVATHHLDTGWDEGRGRELGGWGISAPVSGLGRAAHLKGVLLEETEGMGKHLQSQHLLPIYCLELGLQGEILAKTRGHSVGGHSAALFPDDFLSMVTRVPCFSSSSVCLTSALHLVFSSASCSPDPSSQNPQQESCPLSCRYPTLWPLIGPFLWPFSYALLSTNALCSLLSSTSLAGA